jgi:hypothetical protein
VSVSGRLLVLWPTPHWELLRHIEPFSIAQTPTVVAAAAICSPGQFASIRNRLSLDQISKPHQRRFLSTFILPCDRGMTWSKVGYNGS